MPQFDVQGARKAGYTDAQIAEHLGQASSFDTKAARTAGYSDSDIISRLAGSAPAPVAPEPAAIEPEDPGTAKSILIGTGRTVDRVVKGAQQVYYGVTGNDKAQAELKQTAADDDTIYAGLQKKHPIATAVGESLPSMAIPAGGTATTLGTIGKLAFAGAAPEALKYGSVGERAFNAAAGAAGSVGFGYVVPKAFGAAKTVATNTLRGLVGDVTPEALALAARAEAAGIKVNVAQLGDSKFLKTLSSSLEQMPFTGAAKINGQQRKQFTRAISNTFGDDVDAITPAVYSRNRKRLGDMFNDLSMRNTLNIDNALVNRLDGVLNEARQFGDDGTIRAVESVYDRVINQANASSRPVRSAFAGIPANRTVMELPGASYQSIDSSISGITKAGGEKSVYLAEMQKAIRDAMDRSISPADKTAWDTARMQYKNLKAVRNAVAKDGSSGIIEPNALLQALNSTEAGKEAMAMGTRGQLGEVAKMGRQFVRDAIPNSATAQRAIAMGLIGGGGYAFGADPLTIAGMVAGAATSGRTLTKVLNSPKVLEGFKKPAMTLAESLAQIPGRVTQTVGAGAGMTLANMVKD